MKLSRVKFSAVIVGLALTMTGCAGSTLPSTLDVVERGVAATDILAEEIGESCRAYMLAEVDRCSLEPQDGEAIACVEHARDIGLRCKAFVDVMIEMQEAVADALPKLRVMYSEIEPVIRKVSDSR